LATKFCSIIYEGTAPRYAPEGSQPTSNPVAPKQVQLKDTSLAVRTGLLKLKRRGRDSNDRRL